MAETRPKVADLTDVPGAKARDLQHPALVGQPGVEVAERSQDVEKSTSTSFEKVFVTLRRQYDLDQEGVHKRNKVQVRQFLLHQGLRTDASVEFVGEEELPTEQGVRDEDRSVALRYRITAEPAVTATDPVVVHMQVPEDQKHPLEDKVAAKEAGTSRPSR